MIPEDKQKHFWVGVAVSITTIFLPVVWSLLIVATLGAGKEIYDKLSGKGTPELMDFVATVAGAMPVILLRLFL